MYDTESNKKLKKPNRLVDFLRNLWNENPWSRLKKEHESFYKVAMEYTNDLASTPKTQPQAIQGMWQAYGQMRAARTTTGGAIVTAGIFGMGLWYYKQGLANQRKEFDKYKKKTNKEITENQSKIADNESKSKP